MSDVYSFFRLVIFLNYWSLQIVYLYAHFKIAKLMILVKHEPLALRIHSILGIQTGKCLRMFAFYHAESSLFFHINMVIMANISVYHLFQQKFDHKIEVIILKIRIFGHTEFLFGKF